MSVQPILGAALVATAVPVAWWSVSRPRPAGGDPARRLRGDSPQRDLRDLELAPAGGVRLSRSFVGAVGRIADRLSPLGTGNRLDARLAAAGVAWPSERFFASRVLLLVVGGVVGLVTFAASPGTRTLLLAVGLTVGGWYLPIVALNQRAARRTEEIRRALPDTFDQVTIAVEAGISFEAAMARVAANGTGALAEELARTLQDVQLGVPRAEALAGLAKRSALPEVHALVGAIQQSERYGVPIASILRTQAAELRERRRQLAEEQAMKIPVKVVFPLVFCILPALFIVIIGPAALRFIENGGITGGG